MHFIVNELSLAGQFPDSKSFDQAMELVMKMRTAIQRSGHQLKAHQSFSTKPAIGSKTLVEALQSLSREKLRAVAAWLMREGPFWENERVHSSNDWLEVAEAIVTDTGIGEAAWVRHSGQDSALVSFSPSEWCFSPICVTHRLEDEENWTTRVPNYWSLVPLTEDLGKLEPPLQSWKCLEDRARENCDLLFLADDAFVPLQREPFGKGPADRLLERLLVLNRLKGLCTDEGMTDEGIALYTEHFTGGKAWFTDCSDGEKREFASDLRFPHPEEPDSYIDAYWHGKVKSPQYRIHFSWPINSKQTLYVVYVGPKITKR